jgi:hypothetical protein
MLPKIRLPASSLNSNGKTQAGLSESYLGSPYNTFSKELGRYRPRSAEKNMFFLEVHSLDRVFRARSWSRLLVLGAVFVLKIEFWEIFLMKNEFWIPPPPALREVFDRR